MQWAHHYNAFIQHNQVLNPTNSIEAEDKVERMHDVDDIADLEDEMMLSDVIDEEDRDKFIDHSNWHESQELGRFELLERPLDIETTVVKQKAVGKSHSFYSLID